MKRALENLLADEIVSVLAPNTLQRCSEEPVVVRYVVRSSSLRLRSIVLYRQSLRHLLRDPLKSVKIEYLQRDLLRSALESDEFRYPHPRHADCFVRAPESSAEAEVS